MSQLVEKDDSEMRDVVEDAEKRVKKCLEEVTKAKTAKGIAASSCRGGYSSKGLRKAKRQLNNARNAAQKAERYLDAGSI